MTTTIVVQEVPLEQIVPTTDNKRRIHEGSPEFKEFVENIRALGVLEPGLGRPHPEQAGKIELRAGERRWRACRAAGFDTMPVLVREMTDAEALAVTVTENLQRESLHPLEEGETLALLLERGWTAEQAANQLGKSTKWVLRRARLTELIEEWREAVTDPETPVSAWSASHLELIARYPAETQSELAKEWIGKGEGSWLRSWTLAELRDELGDYLQQISLAPWDVEAADLVPGVGACVGCPKRSDVQPELWDKEDYGEAGPGARCLDNACWDAKGEVYLKGKLAELEAKHGRVVCLAERSWNYRGPFEPDVGMYYTGCKKNDKGAVMVLWVEGPKTGRSYWARKTSGNGATRSNAGGDGQEKSVRPLAERRAQLERIRCRMVNAKIVARLSDWTRHGAGPPEITGHCAVRLAVIFGTARNYENAGMHHDSATGKNIDPWKRLEEWKERGLAELDRDLLLHVIPVLVRRVQSESGQNDFQKPVKPHTAEGRAVCELFDMRWDDLYAEASKEKPEPKSWAKEAEAAKGKKAGVKGAGRTGGDEEE